MCWIARVRQAEIEREAIHAARRQGACRAMPHGSRRHGGQTREHRAKWEGERDVLKKIQENKDRIEHLKIRLSRPNSRAITDVWRDSLRQDSGGREADRGSSGRIPCGFGQRGDDQGGSRCRGCGRGGIPLDGDSPFAYAGFRREKALHMEVEEELHRRVVGQDLAIAAVSDADALRGPD